MGQTTVCHGRELLPSRHIPNPAGRSLGAARSLLPLLALTLSTVSNGLQELLVRRHRCTPQQSVCTQVLELCVMQAPRRALYVIESMAETRGLDVDDYCRLVRIFIMQRVAAGEPAGGPDVRHPGLQRAGEDGGVL